MGTGYRKNNGDTCGRSYVRQLQNACASSVLMMKLMQQRYWRSDALQHNFSWSSSRNGIKVDSTVQALSEYEAPPTA